MQLLTLTLTDNTSFAKAKLIKSISRCHYFSHDSVSIGSQMTVPDLIPSKTEIETGVTSFMWQHNIS